MKIIKQGKSKEEIDRITKRVRQFECPVCGCVFEADNTEYKHHYNRRKRRYKMECNCLNCGKLLTIVERGVINYEVK